jgi:hypothetical protein
MSKEIKEVSGYVHFLNVGIGSRSEGFRPFLLGSDVSVYRLHHVGDDEFFNQRLVPLRGKYCKIKGTFLPEADLLRVEMIEELPDPFLVSELTGK